MDLFKFFSWIWFLFSISEYSCAICILACSLLWLTESPEVGEEDTKIMWPLSTNHSPSLASSWLKAKTVRSEDQAEEEAKELLAFSKSDIFQMCHVIDFFLYLFVTYSNKSLPGLLTKCNRYIFKKKVSTHHCIQSPILAALLFPRF